MNLVSNLEFLGYFIIGYPIAMAIVWTVCGLIFWWRNERGKDVDIESLDIWPYVRILIPCHNEAQIISNTCNELLKIDYPTYQVILIDDASSDNTSEVIREWTRKVDHFHLLRIEENQGKSNALNIALAVTGNPPITVIMDADTIPDPLAIKILVKSLIDAHDIGAVTGQPIVYNRNNLLEKIQAVEFTSIIGLIKRAQNLYGHLFSISGCITAFKTEALHHVNGFSARTATEDIDMTWSLQRAFYRVKYIPQAVVYIQVPNKFSEFWKQRKRWAIGGWHLLRTHKDVFLSWRLRRLWMIYLDILLSYSWSLAFVAGLIIWLVLSPLFMIGDLGINPLPTFTSILILICFIQFIVSFKLNHRYDSGLWKLFIFFPWYPAFYFIVGSLSVCRTAVKGLFQKLDSVGKWRSPVRIKPTKSQGG